MSLLSLSFVFVLTAVSVIAGQESPVNQPVTASPSIAADDQNSPVRNFDEAIDRAINNEKLLVRRLSDKEPVIETYVQEMKVDGDLGFVPKNDFYFLGQLDMKKGIVDKSFLPQSNKLGFFPRLIKDIFTTEYNAGGFADEMFLDGGNLDRTHYGYEYVRREFLGDVRCLVVDIKPLKSPGRHRFEGRIWLEDRDFNIVRFNGRYMPNPSHEFSHFDSWRVSTGALWLPSFIFAQDEGYKFGPINTSPMRAQTRLWDYERARERADQAFANMTVDVPQGVKDDSAAAAENAPLTQHRLFEEQASTNIIDRLQRAGLVSPEGEVDQVLDTVLNNIMVTNNVNLDPQIHARILLTTPLESVSVNHTVLVSRGLIDVLPDESSLAAVLAHELAHIVLGHSINTKYAFADRLLFDDPAILKKLKVARTEEEEKAADDKALELLKNSPYAANLPKVGLFLRMLSERSDEVPHLIRPLLGNKMSDKHRDLRMGGLMDSAPELKIRDKGQISALPLGSRIKMDPWSDQIRLIKSQSVALANAKEKLPFQITPFMLHLTREDWSASAPPQQVQPVANVTPTSSATVPAATAPVMPTSASPAPSTPASSTPPMSTTLTTTPPNHL